MQKEEKPGTAVYELYFKPETHKTVQTVKIADLEKRLTDVEHLIGTNHSGQPTLHLVSTVEGLKEKLNLLATPKQLEVLHRQVQSITQDIDKLTEKKQKQEEDAAQKQHEAKVNEIFDLVNRWDVTSQQLPVIVSRLQSLRALHEEGASFQQGVQQLETQQEEIKKLLKFNGELMAQVDENFKSNLSVIQSNVETLEKRFAELSKKLEELGMETF